MVQANFQTILMNCLKIKSHLLNQESLDDVNKSINKQKIK